MGLLSSIGKVVGIATGVSGLLGGDSGSGQNAANQAGWTAAEAERQFKNRLQWIQEDAQKAGIHPLAAIGAPVSAPAVGGFGDSSSRSSVADRVSNMGQGISRAIESFNSREEREILKASATLDLENKQLQNDRLRSEIRLMTQPGTPPGFTIAQAIPGQGDVRVNPADLIVADKSNRGVQAGRGRDPLNVETRAYDGGTMLVPSSQYSDALEGNHLKQLEYMLRNDLPFYLEKLSRGWHPRARQYWKGGK